MQQFSQQNPPGKVAQDFLREIYRVLEVRLDHAVDPQADYLFRNVIVQRCVGMQLALGYSGERKTRPLPAKLAQAFLDVRSTTLIMMYALKSVTGAPTNENDARKQQEIDAWKTGRKPFTCRPATCLANHSPRGASINRRSYLMVHLPNELHCRRDLPAQSRHAIPRLHGHGAPTKSRYKRLSPHPLSLHSTNHPLPTIQSTNPTTPPFLSS